MLLGVHHPPFTTDETGRGGRRGEPLPSPVMPGQIDTGGKDVCVYPHGLLSGDSDNYERYTAFFDLGGSEIVVPFIVGGDGGHAVDPLIRPSGGLHYRSSKPENADGIDLDKQLAPGVKRLRPVKYDSEHYGYLRIHIDKESMKI